MNEDQQTQEIGSTNLEDYLEELEDSTRLSRAIHLASDAFTRVAPHLPTLGSNATLAVLYPGISMPQAIVIGAASTAGLVAGRQIASPLLARSKNYNKEAYKEQVEMEGIKAKYRREARDIKNNDDYTDTDTDKRQKLTALEAQGRIDILGPEERYKELRNTASKYSLVHMAAGLAFMFAAHAATASYFWDNDKPQAPQTEQTLEIAQP